MGQNHKENLVKCIKDWHTLSLKQVKTLREGNIDIFENLLKDSSAIQTHFGELISALKQEKLDQASLRMIKEIQAIQAGLIAELKKGTQELSNAIGSLRKNKNSMKGYRQTASSIPRFKNERT